MSPTECGVSVCECVDRDASTMRRPRPELGCCAKEGEKEWRGLRTESMYSSVTLSLQRAVSCYCIYATIIYSTYVSASVRKHFTIRKQYNFIMREDDITVTYILPLL